MPSAITLNDQHPAVQYLCKKDKRLAKVIRMVGPITYVPHSEEEIYSFLVHEIIEQMLSVKAGRKIFGRLEDLCGGKVTPENVNTFSDLELQGIGTSSSKVKAIRAVTNAVLNSDLDFKEKRQLSDQEIIKKLTSLHGIGNWTAKMFLIFVLDRPDVLPVEDSAFLQTYRWLYKTTDCSKSSVHKRCQKWKPYSSVASRYFYRAPDMGFTQEDFHLFRDYF